MSGFLKRACPLCGARPPGLAAVVTEPAAEAMAYDDLVSHWNGFFKDKVFFSYVRCPSCGLLYAPTFFDAGQLSALYAQMPPNMVSVPLPALRKAQRGYFDVLKAHSDLAGDYIEIGPDIGLFAENCLREGNFSRYWMFEPNRDVEPALNTLLAGKDFAVIHDMFGFGAVPDGTAGVAVMVHVLDHLLDPVGTLTELRRKLRPDGKIAIVTHDESSLLRRVFGRRWPAFCLQHPELYNGKSMRALMEKAGFQVLEIRKTTNYFEVGFLLQHLLWALGLKVRSVPRFGGLVVGLRLGNMITVATPQAGRT